jgi:hypothetical protein
MGSDLENFSRAIKAGSYSTIYSSIAWEQEGLVHHLPVWCLQRDAEQGGGGKGVVKISSGFHLK